MATWSKRVLVLVVLMAMVAGLTPSASAQQPPGAGPQPAALAQPETFVPTAVNRTPVGGPIPDDRAGSVEEGIEQPSVNQGDELVERRTEASRTFAAEDGAYQTVLYDAPVNFRDAKGTWQSIDSSLVPAGLGGRGLRTKAGPVQVSLPADAAGGAIRVANGDRFVDFALKGAKGLPRVGGPSALPALSEEASRARATYSQALPGVDLSYTALPEGVKEELVLSGPDAPSAYDFALATSAGLSATETPGGGVALVDENGATWSEFSPPFAYDGDYETSGDPARYSSEAVSLRILEASPELVLRLEVDPAWLAAPERVWPVVVDPTLTIPGASADTYLGSGTYANTNYGSSTIMGIGGGSTKIRALHRRDLSTTFTEPAVITSATLDLYVTNDTSASPSRYVTTHEVTSSWSSSQATWNSRFSGTPWAGAGGDFDPLYLSRANDVLGAPGWRRLPITRAVQGWVDQTTTNHGVIVKYEDESAGPQVIFASSNATDATRRPKLVINWEPLTGVRAPFAHQSFDLGVAQAEVNLASGNLALGESDLGLVGTGLDAVVQRFYNSRSPYLGTTGSRWNMWPQSLAGIHYSDVEDPLFRGGPGGDLVFSPTGRPDGSFTTPHGYRASFGVTNPGLRWTIVANADGSRTTFYPSGEPDQFSDRNGNVVTFNYVNNPTTGALQMASLSDSQGRVTTFEQSGPYQVTKMVDPAGRTHRYAYGTDSFGNIILTSYTDPAGKATTYGYTGRAVLNRITDPNGNVTTFATDADQRLTSLTRVSDPATGTGPTWGFDYSLPWQTKVTDPNGETTTHHFDRRGRVTRVVDALGHEQASTYDANSNVIDRTSAGGNVSLATFDADNNLIGTELPTGATTALGYNDSRHRFSATETTTTQGHTWGFGYDTVGNLKTVTDPMPTTPGTSTFNYNPNGTVSSSTDAKGATTTYGYDPAGNLTRVTPPSPLGATTIAYDGLSRPTTVTDGKGQVTTTTYDALDRVTQTAVTGGPTVTFFYDPAGRLASRTDPGGTTTFGYDRLNRLITETLPGGATNAYTYDGVGNLTSITDAGGAVSYAYNDVNLVESLTEPGGAVTTFAYDDDNNRTETSYPNGVVQSATYDESDRVKTIAGNRGLSTLTSFDYDYTLAGDDTGLRQRVVDINANTTTYHYDPLDRLIEAQTTNSLGVVIDNYTYGYDATGNRTSETHNGVTTTATFDAADQLSARGGVTFSYDANGNQTASSAGQSLVYNAADQTTSLTKAGGSPLSASYAGASQIERKTAGAASFTNSLLGVTAATDAGATLSTTRDPSGALVGLRSGGSRSYYLLDGLGSVVALTDASGSVTHSYAYDPYGVTTETTSSSLANPWRYTGQFQDVSTGLYKMWARYYQPELGRWTQQDPSGLEANSYLYVAGNPVNFVDPSGLVYIDFNVSVGPITVGVAINSNEDGSIGDIHPYGGLSASVPGVSASGSVGTGQVEAGACAQANAYFGYGGSVGACTSTGPFAEGGVGSPQAGVSVFGVL